MPADPSRPNLLLLFPDQWRGDWLNCNDERIGYGKAPVRTPNIDALAARGTRFTRMITNSPVCAPARACLALGNRRHRTGVWSNGDDTTPGETTLFNRLQARGYRTLTCGKNDLHKGSDDYHNTGWAPRLAAYGFSDAIDQRGKMNAAGPQRSRDRGGAYLSYLRSHAMLDTHVEDYAARQTEPYNWTIAPWANPMPREHFTDDFCGRSALELLDRTPTGQPWCLWVNFPGPHDPHDPPRELQQRYDDVEFPPPVNGQKDLNGRDIEHQQLRRNYAASCEGIDEWVGWIIDEVDRRGELDNTIIVFFSDHGEMLGDHGRWQKTVWQEPSVNVPLVVAGPGIEQGKISDALVELIDVHATCLDLAGIDVPDDIDGQSFAPLLHDGKASEHRDVMISALGFWRMICDPRWKLVAFDDDAPGAAGETWLYDLDNDPSELTNVADDHPDEVARLAKLLDEHSPSDLRPRNGPVAF